MATIVGLDLGKVLFQQGKLDQLYLLVRELRIAAEAYRLQYNPDFTWTHELLLQG